MSPLTSFFANGANHHQPGNPGQAGTASAASAASGFQIAAPTLGMNETPSTEVVIWIKSTIEMSMDAYTCNYIYIYRYMYMCDNIIYIYIHLYIHM